MPKNQIYSEGVENISVRPASGKDVLFINGNRDDALVIFPHKKHINIVGEENCEKCHSISGFDIVLYGLKEHNKTNFKLAGSHLAIPCQSCHLLNNTWSFRIKNEKCVYCHENVHGNTIDKKYFGDKNCEKCHTVNNWEVKDFDHDRTNFALLGIHKTISCSKCHIKTTFSGKKVHLFNLIRANCTFCHEDIHRKQFEKAGETKCDNCHDFNNWKAVNFHHDTTKFPLDGKHENVECSKCHKKVKTQKGEYTLYRIENYRCIDCHK
jgi:nitrate/TMAO reductase-like tetraheme cytochrome c subunit